MSNGETLSAQVAEEIRAMLARRRVSGRELARRLAVSSPWVSNRLTGHQEIGLNELERIAAALDVEVAELLPPIDQPSGERVLTRRLTGSYPSPDLNATPGQPTRQRPQATRPYPGSPDQTTTGPQPSSRNPRPVRLSRPAGPHPPGDDGR
jgi:transcriptional regulator with XRE-family HTH domain